MKGKSESIARKGNKTIKQFYVWHFRWHFVCWLKAVTVAASDWRERSEKKIGTSWNESSLIWTCFGSMPIYTLFHRFEIWDYYFGSFVFRSFVRRAYVCFITVYYPWMLRLMDVIAALLCPFDNTFRQHRINVN